MNEIIKDPRLIKKLVYPGEGGYWGVGKFGITSIEPYEEDGEMGPTLWFRIRKGKSLHARVQAKYIMEIIYTIPAKNIRRPKKEKMQ